MRKEWCAGDKGHALFNGPFGKVIGIAAPAVSAGELGPEKHTALGCIEFNCTAQLTAQGFGHDAGTLGVGAANHGQRIVQPIECEVMRGDGLGQVAGVGITELLAHGGVGQQCGRRNHPTQTQTRRQNFAERSAMSQPVTATWNIVAQGQQTWRWWLVEIQFAVWIVFHHQRFGAGCNFQNLLAPRQAQGRPAWACVQE
jgi:hypothetical protein